MEGRAWRISEARERYEEMREKLEMIEGCLCWTEGERPALLGLLLENAGLNTAVKLAPDECWRAALEIRECSEGRRVGRAPRGAGRTARRLGLCEG